MTRLLFSILIFSAACSGGDAKQSPTTPTNDDVIALDDSESSETAEERPLEDPADTEGADTGPASGGTNLLVLPKDWSKAEVKTYMKQVTKGLGVQCDHCHDPANFASDGIPAKLTARKMISMARMLDQENFEGKGRITCMTCHKGALQP